MNKGTRELRSGWGIATLADLTEFVTSGSRGWAAHYADNGPLFLRVGNLNHGTVVLDFKDVVHVAPPPGEEGTRTRVRPGDVLLSITADVGMVGLAPAGLDEAYVNQHVALLRPLPSVYPQGLAYSLLDPQGLQAVVKKVQYGATKPGLSLIQVRGFEVPVPPLPEQHRIVESIDSHLTRLDDAVATLERVQRNLKRYRASVLKAAVEGRLVPTEAELARAEKRDYEPAERLLERILTERRRRWEEAELVKMSAKGKPPKDEKWKTEYEEPAAPETNGLPQLPNGWCWASPAQFFVWSSGDFLPKKDQLGGDVPVYGGNGINGRHDRALVDRPTLVIGRVGAQCGNIHLTEGPAWVTDNAIFATGGVEIACLAYWRLVLSQQNLNAAAAGTGQPYVNQKHLNSLVVPLAPEAEQRRIADATDEKLSLVWHLELEATSALQRCARLRQSILKWAFEGKLADQDPNDEPASALLERIRSERAAASADKKSPGRKPGRPAKKS